MSFLSELLFWVAPEHREAKLAYIVGAKSLSEFVRAVGLRAEVIEKIVDELLREMGLDREKALHAIAKLWRMEIRIEKEVRHGTND